MPFKLGDILESTTCGLTLMYHSGFSNGLDHRAYQMGEIYQQAHLNIDTTSSGDSQGEIFRARGRENGDQNR